jgi:hypothetical protein
MAPTPRDKAFNGVRLNPASLVLGESLGFWLFPASVWAETGFP